MVIINGREKVIVDQDLENIQESDQYHVNIIDQDPDHIVDRDHGVNIHIEDHVLEIKGGIVQGHVIITVVANEEVVVVRGVRDPTGIDIRRNLRLYILYLFIVAS